MNNCLIGNQAHDIVYDTHYWIKHLLLSQKL